jgi:hypothetical protein
MNSDLEGTTRGRKRLFARFSGNIVDGSDTDMFRATNPRQDEPGKVPLGREEQSRFRPPCRNFHAGSWDQSSRYLSLPEGGDCDRAALWRVTALNGRGSTPECSCAIRLELPSVFWEYHINDIARVDLNRALPAGFCHFDRVARFLPPRARARTARTAQ